MAAFAVVIPVKSPRPRTSGECGEDIFFYLGGNEDALNIACRSACCLLYKSVHTALYMRK
jgi:hypothetical protein